jgi:hypothetical protein
MRSLVVLMFVFALFQTEFGFATIFVFTRNTFMVALGWIPISAVLRFFMQSNGRSAPRRLDATGSLGGVTLVRYEVIPPVR